MAKTIDFTTDVWIIQLQQPTSSINQHAVCNIDISEAICQKYYFYGEQESIINQ